MRLDKIGGILLEERNNGEEVGNQTGLFLLLIKAKIAGGI